MISFEQIAFSLSLFLCYTQAIYVSSQPAVEICDVLWSLSPPVSAKVDAVFGMLKLCSVCVVLALAGF